MIRVKAAKSMDGGFALCVLSKAPDHYLAAVCLSSAFTDGIMLRLDEKQVGKTDDFGPWWFSIQERDALLEALPACSHGTAKSSKARL
jgi:pimeloyl-ACP methyl ester carboxylesterase